jgi:3'-phosphoadenosine 5'-phosphosulfate sulfotransferase (PAPS reductase)/FAD synthetase
MSILNPYEITEPTCITFSGGRTSAYMLYQILQANDGLPNDAIVCFANTGKEHHATLQFIKDCEKNWNVKINWVEYLSNEPMFKVVDFDTASRNGEPFEMVLKKYNKLPNPSQRWCTGKLKITTIHKYLKSLGWDHSENDNNDFVGIRYDELRRSAKMPIYKTPLVAAKVIKQDIFDFWNKQSFDLQLPIIDGETVGGNCDLCFLKSFPKIVSLVRQEPERALWWAKMESSITAKGNGNKFRKDRPSYQQIIDNNINQNNLFDDGDIACFCGD